MIGRIDCGTESIIDKSKSIKTSIMQLFQDENPHIEGADNFNACFGGTAALFNCLAWCDSSFNTENKFGLVIASDLAKYDPNGAPGARATGGAGAVAILVGRNAPHLVIDPAKKGCYSQHVWDFYKPYMEQEFPVVDAPATLKCYFEAVDQCVYELKKNLNGENIANTFDYHIFHSPFYKIVEKSFARICCNEQENNFLNSETLTESNKTWSKETERAWVAKSKEDFLNKVHPTLTFSQRIGNMYTPSIYGSLVSLLAGLANSDFVETGQNTPVRQNSQPDNAQNFQNLRNAYSSSSLVNHHETTADTMSVDGSHSNLSNFSVSHADLVNSSNSSRLVSPVSLVHGNTSNIVSKSNETLASQANPVKNVSMFSYGSGLISSIYTIKMYAQPQFYFESSEISTPNDSNMSLTPLRDTEVDAGDQDHQPVEKLRKMSDPMLSKNLKENVSLASHYNSLFSFKNLANNCKKIVKNLDARSKISPAEFIEILSEKNQRPGLYTTPDSKNLESKLFENSFYLASIDDKFRRKYTVLGSKN